MDYREMFQNEDSFLEVADLYYNRNFGKNSKSVLDLLMFKIFYKKLEAEKGGKAPTEYELSNMLAITPKRVRDYIEKMDLAYPPEHPLPWQEEVRALFKTSSIQQINGKEEIQFFICNARLRNQIEDFLGSNYFATEYTLNKKLIVLRKPALCALVYECCTDSDRDRILQMVEQETEETKEFVQGQIKQHSWWYKVGSSLLSEVWNMAKEIIVNTATNVGTATILGNH